MALLVLGHRLLKCLPMAAAMLFCGGISALQSRGTVYQRLNGVDVQSPCLAIRLGVSTLLGCAAWCQRASGCKAGSYNSATRRCCVSALFAHEDGVLYEENPNSVYFQIPTNTVQHGNWTLVFRVLQGSGQNVYTTWNLVGKYHDYGPAGSDIELGCITLNGSYPCKTLFRSHVLDVWEALQIKKVRVTLYRSGLEVLSIVFNGTGSTNVNWFSPERVLNSPWNDLSKDATYYNSFSIVGIDIHGRRFFINKSYAGCPGDTGWLVVVDNYSNRSPCAWENYPTPGIFYSGSNSQVVWENQSYNIQRADVFAVLVQF